MIVGPDGAEHDTKGHWAATGLAVPDSLGNPIPSGASQAITGQCSYTHGTNANCTTKCAVNLTGGATHAELGTLNAPGSHMVNHGWQNGTFTGSGTEASCTGYFGGAAANCFNVFGTCLPTVTVSAGGVTMSTGGSKVWTSQPNPVSLKCAAKPDPQNQKTVSDLGGTDPNEPPCDLGFSGNNAGPCSPIIIDTEGEGFHLTSAANGVMFDIRGDGHLLQIAWTAPGSHNAFLVLDRNGDGIINNGKELFGNFTTQDPTKHKNGFLALSEFDEPDQGGNGDGVIDEHDAVFSRLRLWIDDNHDGISQPNELHALAEFGIHLFECKLLQLSQDRRLW